MATAATVVLGLVFLASGASKLVAPTWPSTAAAFGLPPIGARLLPPAELGLGAAATVGLGTPWVTAVLVALLVVFTAGILLRMRDPEPPPCACFGGWSSRPVGWRSVGRNLVLLAVGAVALVG